MHASTGAAYFSQEMLYIGISHCTEHILETVRVSYPRLIQVKKELSQLKYNAALTRVQAGKAKQKLGVVIMYTS